MDDHTIYCVPPDGADGGPLIYAVVGRDDKSQMVQELIDAGADVNKDTKDGDSVLMIAARYVKPQTFKVLMEAGA